MPKTSSRSRRTRWTVSGVAGIAAFAGLSGCATSVILVGKPAPVPDVNRETLEDLERLASSWCRYPGGDWRGPCLRDGDALVDYLAEVERYRCYIAELRDEPLEDCPQ